MRASEEFRITIKRSAELCSLFSRLKTVIGGPVDFDDLLRAAVVGAVSALDRMVHELVRQLSLGHLIMKLPLERATIPFDTLLQETISEQLQSVDQHISRSIAHKSFQKSGKIKEALSDFCPNIWENVSDEMRMESKSIRERLDLIVDWRNRIVHESDVDPSARAGLLHSIYIEDVVGAVEFVEQVGLAIIEVLQKKYNTQKIAI